jgi:hypothetical protein
MAVPDYLEDVVKDYATQATASFQAPLAPETFTGRQFIAGEDPLQTQAIGMATQGVGSYAPFLTAAQAAQAASANQVGQAVQTAGGLGALTGSQAYQPFMSPYQSQVIDETLRQFDIERSGGRQAIQDSAVASGNFGGGREGAMLGQYDSDSLANRAGIRAGLLQQNLMQAQQQAQQAFQNQRAMGQDQLGLANAYRQQGVDQMGLSNFARTGMGQDISALGSLGALRSGLEQSRLSADQQQQRAMAMEPYGRLTQYGNILGTLSGGVAGQQYAEPQPVSPFQSALSTALGIGGLYGKIFD